MKSELSSEPNQPQKRRILLSAWPYANWLNLIEIDLLLAAEFKVNDKIRKHIWISMHPKPRWFIMFNALSVLDKTASIHTNLDLYNLLIPRRRESVWIVFLKVKDQKFQLNYLPQLFSSDPSAQSFSPLQKSPRSIQLLSPHAKKPSWHSGSSVISNGFTLRSLFLSLQFFTESFQSHVCFSMSK